MVAALLFTQAALAVAGCDLGQRSAAQAVAAVGEAPCHDHEAPGALESNANLCVVHCTSDAQNVESAVFALQPFPALAVLTVPPAPEACSVDWRRPAAACPYAAPPVRILTHNLRI